MYLCSARMHTRAARYTVVHVVIASAVGELFEKLTQVIGKRTGQCTLETLLRQVLLLLTSRSVGRVPAANTQYCDNHRAGRSTKS